MSIISEYLSSGAKTYSEDAIGIYKAGLEREKREAAEAERLLKEQQRLNDEMATVRKEIGLDKQDSFVEAVKKQWQTGGAPITYNGQTGLYEVRDLNVAEQVAGEAPWVQFVNDIYSSNTDQKSKESGAYDPILKTLEDNKNEYVKRIGTQNYNQLYQEVLGKSSRQSDKASAYWQDITLGNLQVKRNSAWDRYYMSGLAADRQVAEGYDEALSQFGYSSPDAGKQTFSGTANYIPQAVYYAKKNLPATALSLSAVAAGYYLGAPEIGKAAGKGIYSLGTIASGFQGTMEQTRGGEFGDMVKLGVPESIAKKAANESAFWQSLIEEGETAVDLFNAFKVPQQASTMNAFKKFFKNWGVNIITEGLEEGSQSVVGYLYQWDAMDRAGVDTSDMSFGNMVEQAWEEAKGGAEIGLTMYFAEGLPHIIMSDITNRNTQRQIIADAPIGSALYKIEQKVNFDEYGNAKDVPQDFIKRELNQAYGKEIARLKSAQRLALTEGEKADIQKAIDVTEKGRQKVTSDKGIASITKEINKGLDTQVVNKEQKLNKTTKTYATKVLKDVQETERADTQFKNIEFNVANRLTTGQKFAQQLMKTAGVDVVFYNVKNYREGTSTYRHRGFIPDPSNKVVFINAGIRNTKNVMAVIGHEYAHHYVKVANNAQKIFNMYTNEEAKRYAQRKGLWTKQGFPSLAQYQAWKEEMFADDIGEYLSTEEAVNGIRNGDQSIMKSIKDRLATFVENETGYTPKFNDVTQFNLNGQSVLKGNNLSQDITKDVMQSINKEQQEKSGKKKLSKKETTKVEVSKTETKSASRLTSQQKENYTWYKEQKEDNIGRDKIQKSLAIRMKKGVNSQEVKDELARLEKRYNQENSIKRSAEIVDSSEAKKEDVDEHGYVIGDNPRERDNFGNLLPPDVIKKFKDSKIRDKYGRLVVMFHGTAKDFDAFSRIFSGSNFGDWSSLGGGFYFTPNEETALTWAHMAKGYNPHTISVFLNVKNPFNILESAKENAKILEMAKEIERIYNKYSEYSGEKKIDISSGSPEYLHGYKIFKFLEEFLNYNNTQIERFIRSYGYDGVIDGSLDRNSVGDAYASTEVVVYNRNAIKLTSNEHPTSSISMKNSAEITDYFGMLMNDKSFPKQYNSAAERLSPGIMKKYKLSAVRDKKGRLELVYHTTGDELDEPFYIFAPEEQDRSRYRYNGQTVIFATNNRKMSTSYAANENLVEEVKKNKLKITLKRAQKMLDDLSEKTMGPSRFVIKKEYNAFGKDPVYYVENTSTGEREIEWLNLKTFKEFFPDWFAQRYRESEDEWSRIYAKGKRNMQYPLYMNIIKPFVVDGYDYQKNEPRSWDQLKYTNNLKRGKQIEKAYSKFGMLAFLEDELYNFYSPKWWYAELGKGIEEIGKKVVKDEVTSDFLTALKKSFDAIGGSISKQIYERQDILDDATRLWELYEKTTVNEFSQEFAEKYKDAEERAKVYDQLLADRREFYEFHKDIESRVRQIVDSTISSFVNEEFEYPDFEERDISAALSYAKGNQKLYNFVMECLKEWYNDEGIKNLTDTTSWSIEYSIVEGLKNFASYGTLSKFDEKGEENYPTFQAKSLKTLGGGILISALKKFKLEYENLEQSDASSRMFSTNDIVHAVLRKNFNKNVANLKNTLKAFNLLSKSVRYKVGNAFRYAMNEANRRIGSGASQEDISNLFYEKVIDKLSKFDGAKNFVEELKRNPNILRQYYVFANDDELNPTLNMNMVFAVDSTLNGVIQEHDVDGKTVYSVPYNSFETKNNFDRFSDRHDELLKKIIAKANEENNKLFHTFLTDWQYNTSQEEILEVGGYDGVIFKNIDDYGHPTYDTRGGGNVYVAFASNQVDLASNKNPTMNPDIRRSAEITDDTAPKQKWNGRASDVRNRLVKYANSLKLKDGYKINVDGSRDGGNKIVVSLRKDTYDGMVVDEDGNRVSKTQTVKEFEASTSDFKDKESFVKSVKDKMQREFKDAIKQSKLQRTQDELKETKAENRGRKKAIRWTWKKEEQQKKQSNRWKARAEKGERVISGMRARAKERQRMKTLNAARRELLAKMTSFEKSKAYKFMTDEQKQQYKETFGNIYRGGISKKPKTRQLEIIRANIAKELVNDPNIVVSKKVKDMILAPNKVTLDAIETIEQANELLDAYKKIVEQVQKQQQLVGLKKAEDAIEKQQEFIDTVRELDAEKRDKKYLRDEKRAERDSGIGKVVNALQTGAEKTGEALSKFFETALSTIETELLRIAQGNRKSKLMQIYENLNEGVTRERSAIVRLRNIMSKYLNEKEYQTLRKQLNVKSDWVDTGVDVEDTEGRTHRLVIDHGRLMALAMHSMQEQSLKHISGAVTNLWFDEDGDLDMGKSMREGGGLVIPDMRLAKQGKLQRAVAEGYTVKLTPEEINEIVGKTTDAKGNVTFENLSKEENDFIKSMQEFFEQTREYTNEVYRELHGFDLPEVENYFPIVADKSFIYTKISENATAKTIAEAYGMFDKNGFVKERQDNAFNPIVLENVGDTLTRMMNGVAKYYGYNIALHNNHILLNAQDGNFSVKKALKRLAPDFEKDYDTLAGFIAGTMAHPNDVIARFRGRHAEFTLGLNPSSWVKQLLSVPTTMKYFTAKDMAGYVSGGMVTLQKTMEDYLKMTGEYKKGEVLRTFVKYMTEDLEYRSELFGLPDLSDAIDDKSMFSKIDILKGIARFDRLGVTTVTRMFLYAELAKRNLLGDELTKISAEEADSVFQEIGYELERFLRQTQPDYSQTYRANISRNSGPLARFLTMYSTPALQMTNNMLQAAYELNYAIKTGENVGAAWNKMIKSALGVAIASLGSVVIARAFSMLLKGGDDDDEDYDFGKELIVSMLAPTLVLDDLARGFLGMNTYESQTPELIAIDALIEIGSSLNEIWTGEPQNAYNKWKKIFTNMGLLFGIPARDIYKLGKAVLMYSQSDLYWQMSLRENPNAYKKFIETEGSPDTKDFYRAYTATRESVLKKKYGYHKADKEKNIKSNKKESFRKALVDVFGNDTKKVNQYMTILGGYKN